MRGAYSGQAPSIPSGERKATSSYLLTKPGNNHMFWPPSTISLWPVMKPASLGEHEHDRVRDVSGLAQAPQRDSLFPREPCSRITEIETGLWSRR